MNNITTIRGIRRTREQDARGCFRAPTNPSLADDLGKAIWTIITYAVVPGMIIAALWQNQTEKINYIAARSMQTVQRSSQAVMPPLQQTTQYNIGHSMPQITMQTPDGFVVSLSQDPHGGDHDSENQGR